MDSRAEPPQAGRLRAELPDVHVHTGGFDIGLLRRAERIVLSPGVAIDHPAVRDAAAHGVDVLGEVELFASAVNAPVAAITGSNGKSTVTALIGDMLRADGRDVEVGGNLGPNALELLRDPAPDVYVLELSSFQLESTRSLTPAVAAVINLSADHMDRHVDLEAYGAAKARIFRGADVAVINLDDEHVRAMDVGSAHVRGFSLHGADGARASLRGNVDKAVLCVDGVDVMAASEVPLVGRHNLANVLAACCVASALGVSPAAMRRATHAFRGLAHRCELVAVERGVRYVNDSKGTNVGACVAAIEGLQNGRNVVLIAGGIGKQQDFSPLHGPVDRHVHTVVLIGADAPAVAAALPTTVRCLHADDLSHAVREAKSVAVAGDCVLLSPACASFDMFENYAARGESFRRAVQEMIAT